MDKISYSNCPLKKRPIYIINEIAEEEVAGDLVEDGPIDLSVRKWKTDIRIQRNYTQAVATNVINYSAKLETIKEEHYADNNTNLIRSDHCGNFDRIQIKPEPTVNLADIIYQNQRSPTLHRNYNNNFIKSETDILSPEIYETSVTGFMPSRSSLSPAFSTSSFSPADQNFYGNTLEPEDLTVKLQPIRHILSDNSSNYIDNEPKYRKELRDRTNSDLYFQCSVCNKCYSTYPGLTKHQQSHQQIRNTVLVDQTSANTNTNSNQVTSIPNIAVQLQKSQQIQRYQCKDCGKSYSTYSGLTKHQQFHCPNSEGSQVKKLFSCKNCDKVYVSLGALKMHIRTHTLPCKCPLCGKAFSRPWLLQGHIRTHTGEKPFSCQHCNRAFADRSNLRAHLQTHSDVKKYSCQSCTKTFSRMSLLGKHLQGGCTGIQSSSSQQQISYQHQYDDMSMFSESSENIYTNQSNNYTPNGTSYSILVKDEVNVY